MELLEKCQSSQLIKVNTCRMPVRIFVRQDISNVNFSKQRNSLTEFFVKRQL